MDHVFDVLAIELVMMVFDYLVDDKRDLGRVCLVSYEWRRIVQDCYSWKLWICAALGRPHRLRYYSETDGGRLHVW